MNKIVNGIIVLCGLIAFSQPAFSQNLNEKIDSLQQVLEKATTPIAQFTPMRRLSDHYGYSGKPDSVRYYAEQMLKIGTEVQQDSMIALAYGSIANYFSNISDNKKALEYQFKGLGFAEKSGNIQCVWLLLKEIGITFKRLKNYDESVKYLKRAEPLLNVTPSGGNRTYTHMAEVYLALGQQDSALRYIQLANEATSKITDAYGYARVLYIFATVYEAMGDTDLAESYYKKCIAYSDVNSIYAPYVTSTTNYGKFLFNTKQYELAKEYALDGFRKASQAKNKAEMINGAALLRKVYYSLGQKDSSFYYADVKDAYNDSVFNENQRNQIQNLAFNQKLNEHEERLRLEEEEHQREQNAQYALIALGIVSFIILFLLLSRSVIVTEKWVSFFGILGLLIVFEFINLLIHPFLERVTHHSPLLMLIALVALASLLIPLHHRMEKWIKERMTEKNKKIRLENAKRTIEKLGGGESGK